MEWFEAVAREYGVVIALGLLFLVREFWPAIRDRFFPALADMHRRREERDEKARQEQRASDREFYTMLFTLIQQNTTAFTELKSVVQMVSTNLTALGAAVAEQSEDLAAIFAHLKKERPSRGGRNKSGAGVSDDRP